jgi:hypothetical protein
MISYDITKTNQIFTARHNKEQKLTDNVWIGISHTYLPILWCPKCNTWGSHPEILHEGRMSFLKMMAEKNARKEQHYGPSNAGNECYQRKNDRSNDHNNDQSNDRNKDHSINDHPSWNDSHIKKHAPVVDHTHMIFLSYT